MLCVIVVRLTNFNIFPIFPLPSVSPAELTRKDADFCVGHQCHEKARCLNVSPKYTCHCEKGFQGDGFNCTGELTRSFHRTANGNLLLST